MSQTHRVEIEIGDQCFLVLQDEAERLGIDVATVVSRATSAWLVDMCESAVSLKASPAPAEKA